MGRDLFEEFGITPDEPQGRDLFAEAGINPEIEEPSIGKRVGKEFGNIWQEMNEGSPAALTAFNRNLGEVFHGAAQPFLESGVLGQGVKQRSKAEAIRRNAMYEQALREHPNWAMGGNILGETALGLPAAVATGGSSAITKAPGFLKYLVPILKGGTIGGATGATLGATRYGSPEERASQAFSEGLKGLTLGIVAGTLPASWLIGADVWNKYAKHIPLAMKAEKLAESILSRKKQVSDISHAGYEGMHQKAQQAKLENIEIPDIDKSELLRSANPKQAKIINKYFNDPNVENAGKATKTIDKIINKIEKKESESLIELPQSIRLKDKAEQPIEKLREAKNKIEKTLNPFKANIAPKQLEGLPSKIKNKVSEYLKTPSLRNAHNAYKDLGNLIGDLKYRQKTPAGLLTSEQDILENAITMRKEIKSKMFDVLEKSEEQVLAREFERLNKYHKQEVRPYKNPAIVEFETEERLPEDFLKKLSSNYEFRGELGKHHPAVDVRKTLPAILGGIGLGLPALSGVAAYYKNLLGGK